MDLRDLREKLDRVSDLDSADITKVTELARRIAALEKMEGAQKKFIPFVKAMWPQFIEGTHHKIMAEAFERVVDGKLKRLIINMPPRFTKSEFSSYLLPAWFLGRYPWKKVIQSSHTAELSKGFGRKVRDLLASEEYSSIFPGVELKTDSTSAARWNTNQKGEYYAVGVGTNIAGKGADLFIIDDSVSEQEGASGDPSAFDKVYDWYETGPRQRLQPGAAIVIVECMVGDTDVLMGDGSHKLLKDIRTGDEVATYENGVLTTSTVENWVNHGVDSVFTINTKSAKLLRANERHPFLVAQNGELQWVRLRDLKPGMDIVTMERSESTRRGTTESGRERLARLMGVRNPSHVSLSVDHTIKSQDGPMDTIGEAQRKTSRRSSSTDTDYRLTSSRECLSLRAEDVPYANSYQMNLEIQNTGNEACASITVEKLDGPEHSYATSATSWLETSQKNCSSGELSTYEITLDKIVDIYKSGREDVFDVQIARTENFIANGAVSHNTRWNKADLSGRVQKKAASRDEIDEWEVIEFPAILPDGKALWPGYWSKEELLKIKAEIQPFRWNAQYMQSPTSESAAIVKRGWWKKWLEDDPPDCEFVIQSWDTAFTKKTRSDHSACTTWGVFYVGGSNQKKVANLILLDAYMARLEFPDLKEMAFQKYMQFQPDSLVIESRAAGWPLIYELRERGIQVTDYTPSRGEDKNVRVNSVADVFASGIVWYPDKDWAEDVIEQFSDFPNGESDDLVDSSTQAIIRFRQGRFLALKTDYYNDEEEFVPRRADYY